MRTELLNEQIKTRVPEQVKRDLEAIAKSRHLELSDIVREALRLYVAKNDANQMELLGDKAA